MVVPRTTKGVGRAGRAVGHGSAIRSREPQHACWNRGGWDF